MPKVNKEYVSARRAEILEAARRCFVRNGFQATSMQDLFAESGLSAGVIYRYFDSKEAVILAIAEQAIQDVVTAMQAVVSPQHAGRIGSSLAAAIEVIDLQDSERGITALAVQVWAEALRNPELSRRFLPRLAEARAQMQALLERHDGSGLTAAGSPDATAVATAIFAVLPGYIMQRALLGPEAVDGAADACRMLWPQAGPPHQGG